MGCLKFIIKVAIVVLAIIGFKALGGMELFKNLHFFEKPSQDELIAKSMSVADFTKIPTNTKSTEPQICWVTRAFWLNIRHQDRNWQS